ncbi:phosphoadenosine phosphosulfate reductase family protein [Rhizobium sp. P32RR-XVIII]|uniref:phosphoadenosine phosphosulfate reductase domain-containing protein n=1 Tax=Rhizobium sp. P32RR-XVIII TaxID=2726738 RepID=UPI001456CD55|nr:phosphoadenosine phosphosulfate reductase family protein [Rhizobium sp. P32RR-XVIII]NLS02303.1 phosphoadenosine phosphosulfate reductase family protein [Rhizobium sp. P32RR-XVIII]
MARALSDAAVDDAIRAHAPVAIGVSGGKDSQAAALAPFRYLDAMGHAGERLLVHADLGSVEWKDSLPTCQRLADYLGVPLLVVSRKAGGLMERWRSRWQSSVERYEALSTVALVPCWSTPKMRFCTSELKTHVITAALKKRFGKQLVVNVTGIRRDESSRRARSTISDLSDDSLLLSWRPILDWSVQDVFSSIDASGIDPHPAYRVFGMSRVSCRFCIMSNIDDLTAATAQEESHDLYRDMVDLECDSSFAFQGSRWLGDVAPHLLTEALHERLHIAKSTAVFRQKIEAAITKDMLYVKGWPVRMLYDYEADLLASIRCEVSALFGFNASCLDRDSIHARYAQLMADREHKQSAELAYV